MKLGHLLLLVLLMPALAGRAPAGEFQRIGHTTLTPFHANDKGMYAAVIDSSNGYAYFVGSYLYKLDLTGDLPMPVGAPLFTGQFTQGDIDVAAGYAYFTKNSINRFQLGAGTNAVTAAGVLSPAPGTPSCMVVDNSDPNPANHYGYAVCAVSGAPARVVKIALSTFTELGYTNLNPGETNFLLGSLVDPGRGYAYFVSAPITGSNLPFVVKIKLTPGTNVPIRIGATNLDTASTFIDGASIDTVHGYAYYGTYNSDTNVPGRVYKVKLGDGDVTPTVVGYTDLHPGEGRLSASVLDPVNGYVYFANDNSYPGAICQLGLNGTNPPVEVGYWQLQGGTNNSPPPNGVSTSNWADDGTNLPFGEVFIRSAVFDPVRGFAYFGQDSRPNQVVKARLTQIDPFVLAPAPVFVNGSFQFNFANIAGASFNVFTAVNPALPFASWNLLGTVAEISPGQYRFTDSRTPDGNPCFYRVISQ